VVRRATLYFSRAMTPITLDTLSSASPQQLWDALRAVMWPSFCQCTPGGGGAPPPVDYVPPDPPQPPHWPPTPAVDCDDTSLCALVQQLARSVASLQQTVNQDYTIDTLVQRQGVPFGYVPGTVHSALSGNGEFPVAGILGLAVTLDVFPAGHESGSTDPITYHQLGKVSVGTVAGWRRSWQPTHNPYLILPIAGAFTRVGYSFVGGVVATITELLREP